MFAALPLPPFAHYHFLIPPPPPARKQTKTEINFARFANLFAQHFKNILGRHSFFKKLQWKRELFKGIAQM